MSNDIPQGPGIWLPRAQYDALMEAAKALSEIDTAPKWWKMQTEALAALRAAGVEMGGS